MGAFPIVQIIHHSLKGGNIRIGEVSLSTRALASCAIPSKPFAARRKRACVISKNISRENGGILTISALSGQNSSQPRGVYAIPAIAAAPGALSLLSVPLRGDTESAWTQANAIAVLVSALMFLLYFCTTLTERQRPWVSRLALTLRPIQDHLLHGCGVATLVQLCAAACLCLSHPIHSEGVLVPLYTAGYASLAILVASQRGRRLRGRKKLEIEVGEGERHSVMAQGSRIAARNYTWLVLLLHLTLQAVSSTVAIASTAVTAAAAAAATGTVAAVTAKPNAGGVSGTGLLPVPLVVMYGTLAVLYGIAGACKFLPDLLPEKCSTAATSS